MLRDSCPHSLTKASNTRMSYSLLWECSIMMLKRASRVSWRNWIKKKLCSERGQIERGPESHPYLSFQENRGTHPPCATFNESRAASRTSSRTWSDMSPQQWHRYMDYDISHGRILHHSEEQNHCHVQQWGRPCNTVVSKTGQTDSAHSHLLCICELQEQGTKAAMMVVSLVVALLMEVYEKPSVNPSIFSTFIAIS